MVEQQTLKHPVSAKGIGLHSGQPVSIMLKPADEGSGIIFRRVDFNPAVEIKLSADKIYESLLCTTLRQGDMSIKTIEHLLSALAGLEVDNVIIELDSDELPIMDGSAIDFVFLIESAGLIKQQEPRKFLRIKETVRVEDSGRFAEFSPDPYHFSLHLTMDFPHPAISKTPQEITFQFSSPAYIKAVARARTFGSAADLDKLHQQNLALGANLDNAIGLDETKVLNTDGLRFKDEFVRHKLLDAIGDLYVAGAIRGKFRGHKSGHTLNNRLLRKLLASETAHAWCE